MAGVVRTRAKRVTYPLDDKVKARLVGRASYVSSGSDHTADGDISPCLSELVYSFLEEDQASESSSRSPDNNEDYDSDRVDSASDRPGEAVECILRSSANHADAYAKVLHADVAEAVDVFSCLRSDKSVLQRNVMSFLRGKGHNAGICKTKWSSAGSITAGHYDFIDVEPLSSATCQNQSNKSSSNRYFVDVDFAAEFEIARPSSPYSRLVQSLPRHYVGGSDDLEKIVRVMCEAAKKSLRSRELSVPPWRKNRYMQNKWFGPYKRTVNALPENPLSLLFGGAKCRWVGFDDVVCDTSAVTGRVYIRT